MSRGTNWKESLLGALFPRRCAYCGQVIGKGERACAECLPNLPIMRPPFCPVCGVTKELCGCHGHRRAFDGCIPAMRYEGGAKRAVLRLKESWEDDLIDAMAGEMVNAYLYRSGDSPDMMSFVPMSASDLRARGYNQSELLCRAVARRLGIPCEPLLQKLFVTPAQKELSPLQRSGNLLGAFDLNQPDRSLAGANIVLADDVFTTGATMNECAKVLKIYGASRVTVLVFAAAVREETNENPVG